MHRFVGDGRIRFEERPVMFSPVRSQPCRIEAYDGRHQDGQTVESLNFEMSDGLKLPRKLLVVLVS